MGRTSGARAAVASAALLLAGTLLTARPQQGIATAAPALDGAQQLFYSGKYIEAIAATAPLRQVQASALSAYELRTSALHFRIKRLLGSAKDKEAAFKQCQPCPELLKEFMADVTAGRALAREGLKGAPRDEARLYLLAKLDLNEVWLNNSTLGRRKGFGLYKDARRGIDNVLAINASNLRARVAHAWIDYAVDTRIPFGLKWMFGGGDRKRALKNMREAAATKGGHWEEVEASFGLWEMLASEQMTNDALTVARELIVTFPENEELQRFIASGGARKPPVS
jgi:hypothetical protein